MWNEIANKNDLNAFMEMMYGFHDSCIKEFQYTSGAYVAENLSMHPINNQRTVKIVFQRQFRNPCAIEMKFIGLQRLNIVPDDENYTCEIIDATMILKDNCIFGCDCGDLTEEDLDTYEGTLICASRVKWRAAEEYIGKKDVYINC